MDFIERAAQHLVRSESRRSVRGNHKPRRVKAWQSGARPPDGSGLGQKGERRDEPGSGAVVHLSEGASSKVVEIDEKHLGAFQDILSTHGHRSQVAETFRHIKRRVINYNVRKSPEPSNVLMVTSAKADEGKTHIAMNLAMSVALEQDFTVLLVDADLAQPDVVRRLGIEADRGLYDFLDDPSVRLPDILLGTNIEGLSVIPAGRKHKKSTELLASNRMKQLVDEIATHYADRVVIFDAPPLLATTEAATLTKYVRRILFVVESGRTRHPEIERALSLVDDNPVVGFVLNKSRPQIGGIGTESYYSY